MRRRHEERLPGELHGVAARLRDEDVDIDELDLDRLKQRVLAQRRTRARRPNPVQWLVAILTSVVIAGLSSGALAIARFDDHPNTHGGAASDQYKPPKGCGHRAGDESKCKRQGPKDKGDGQGQGNGSHH